MELILKTTERSKPFYINCDSGAYKGDSGFDLYFVEDTIIPAKSTVLINNLDVSIEIKDDTGLKSSLLMARSSIYKTPIRLSNGVGLIDSGYRGSLKVALDNISNNEYIIEKGQRLFQLVCADLKPFDKITLSNDLQETERGFNGFGSSGK